MKVKGGYKAELDLNNEQITRYLVHLSGLLGARNVSCLKIVHSSDQFAPGLIGSSLGIDHDLVALYRQTGS